MEGSFCFAVLNIEKVYISDHPYIGHRQALLDLLEEVSPHHQAESKRYEADVQETTCCKPYMPSKIWLGALREIRDTQDQVKANIARNA